MRLSTLPRATLENNIGYMCTIVHELTHVIDLRNGVKGLGCAVEPHAYEMEREFLVDLLRASSEQDLCASIRGMISSLDSVLADWRVKCRSQPQQIICNASLSGSASSQLEMADLPSARTRKPRSRYVIQRLRSSISHA